MKVKNMNLIDKIILKVLKETAFDDWVRIMKQRQDNWSKLSIVEQFKHELVGCIGITYTEYLNDLTYNENERFDKHFVNDFKKILESELQDLLSKYSGYGGVKYKIFDKDNITKISKIIIDEINKINEKVKPETKPGTTSPYAPAMKLKYVDDILDILTKKKLFIEQELEK